MSSAIWCCEHGRGGRVHCLVVLCLLPATRGLVNSRHVPKGRARPGRNEVRRRKCYKRLPPYTPVQSRLFVLGLAVLIVTGAIVAAGGCISASGAPNILADYRGKRPSCAIKRAPVGRRRCYYHTSIRSKLALFPTT
jgi:hypothetical protein